MTKIRALMVSPISPSGAFWPIPPDGGYAPQWNAYRLAEGLADHPSVHLTVLFPCTQSQILRLRSHQYRGAYEWIIYPDWYIIARRWFKERLPIVRGIISRAERVCLRSATGVSLWTYYDYLRRAARSPAWKRADVIIQNDMPQLLPYYLRHVPREKLVFFCRGQIGATGKPIALQTVEHLAGCGAILVATEQMTAYLRKLLDRHIPEEKQPRLYVVPNGLGPEFPVLAPPPDRFVRPEKRILFAGRICPDKGVRELALAFLQVHRRCPQARLRLVGSKSLEPRGGQLSSYEQEVRQILAQLPPGVVEFAGYVPYQEMPQQYAQADIAVFPSIILEGFGMVALEAMRCGLPVVASNRPGFRELVVHGETGLLVDPEDTDQLASAMIRLIEDPALAKRMGEKGCQRSLLYSVERMTDSFVAFVSDFVSWKEHDGRS
jgi:glycosyltransferase involved in cell wall biosynthesis